MIQNVTDCTVYLKCLYILGWFPLVWLTQICLRLVTPLKVIQKLASSFFQSLALRPQFAPFYWRTAQDSQPLFCWCRIFEFKNECPENAWKSIWMLFEINPIHPVTSCLNLILRNGCMSNFKWQFFSGKKIWVESVYLRTSENKNSIIASQIRLMWRCHFFPAKGYLRNSMRQLLKLYKGSTVKLLEYLRKGKSKLK